MLVSFPSRREGERGKSLFAQKKRHAGDQKGLRPSVLVLNSKKIVVNTIETYNQKNKK